MNDYLKNITPDSFSGIIFALEGIKKSVTLINGPTGCRFYHSRTSQEQTTRYTKFDRLDYPEKWFRHQPRVPCTSLDSRDYIYGSKYKLTETLEYIRDNLTFDLAGIVNSPGAALIGDNLKSIARQTLKDKPFVVIETPGFSSDVCSGYEKGVIELLTQLGLSQTTATHEGTVNILGLSIFHRNYKGDMNELSRLLELCGISINCFLCADCDLEEIYHLPDAALNIVIHSEYGMQTAEFLQQHFGVPCYICDGPPIGFSATEKMMRDICAILGKEYTGFEIESERTRARAYSFISRFNASTGLPKGVKFSIEGSYSELYAYTNFLVKYFGMIPACASPLNQQSTAYQEKYQNLLNDFGSSEALLQSILDTDSELVFANGNTIANLKLRKQIFSGIEIGLPSMGYLDVIPKTHLGLRGALMLTEQIINGLMF